VISDIYAGEPINENRLARLVQAVDWQPPFLRGCERPQSRSTMSWAWPASSLRNARGRSHLRQSPGDQARNQETGTLTRRCCKTFSFVGGQDIQKDAEGKPHPVQVVNLLVTPEQAETLSLASNQTKIQLVLRNPLDTTINQFPVPPWSTSLRASAAKVVKVAAKPKVVKAPRPFQSKSLTVTNGVKQIRYSRGTQ